MSGTLELTLLAAAGVLAGYVNTVAGAGSLLTLPALIFTGLDATAANATNRIAVLCQTGVAAWTFRRGGLRGTGAPALRLALPATLAGGVGAWVATLLDDVQMRLSIAAAMVTFLVLSLLAWQRGLAAPKEATPDVSRLRIGPAMILAFTAIGFYAGFLQAGVGVLILLVFVTQRHVDLVSANAIKVVVVGVLTCAALGVFLWQRAGVDPVRGLILAAATMIGAHAGARATLRRGATFVWAVLVIAVTASVLKLLWDLLPF